MANITFVEMKTTSTGKPYKSAKMDTQVLGKDRFNIFTYHTRYDDVVAGRAFAPEEFQPDGEYIKLRDPDEGVRGKSGGKGGRQNFDVAGAQTRKAEDISKAQDNKDQAIRLSGAMNHAVNIVTTFQKDLTPDEIKSKVLNWRNWFLDNWDLPEHQADEIPW